MSGAWGKEESDRLQAGERVWITNPGVMEEPQRVTSRGVARAIISFKKFTVNLKNQHGNVNMPKNSKDFYLHL